MSGRREVTAERWLAERSPHPPAELATAIRRAVVPFDADESQSVAQRLTAAAEALLPTVVEGECAERSGALDLLTLDALITYAMEAGSGSAEECERAASEALDVIGDAAAATLDANPRVL